VYIRRKSEIKRPGERIVFLDEGKTSVQSWTIYYDRASWWDLPPVRHGAGTNLSFADGHAEYWKWMDQRTLKVSRQEGDWQSLVNLPDNPDIPRLRGAWGQLVPTAMTSVWFVVTPSGVSICPYGHTTNRSLRLATASRRNCMRIDPEPPRVRDLRPMN
jgi:prepilin-type processing-associated H-X9-DG protein